MGDKINILYVTLSLDIGGVEVLLLEFLKALDRSRYNPSVCVLENGGQLVGEFERIGVPVYSIPKKEGIDYRLPSKIRRLIKDKNIQIVHTHNSTPWLYCGIVISILPCVRLIHTKHSNLDPAKKKLLKAEKWLAKKTDHIIADARDVARFMVDKQGISESKIRLIYNGIDTEKFAVADRENVKHRTKVIGIIGRLVLVKDHATLVAAFSLLNRKLKDCELWIIGDGPLKDSLWSMVNSRGLKDNVKFLGNRRDIPELLKQIDVLVLCSLSEGMPIALLEGMAAGMPVIATGVGGNSDIVADGITGFLVPPKSPDVLADKIETILSNPDLAKSMGQEGRKRALDMFSMGKMVVEYQKLYDNVMKKSRYVNRVAIIGEFPPPYGGMAMQAQYLSENLSKEGHKVEEVRRGRGAVKSVLFNIGIFKYIFRADIFYIFANSYLSFYLFSVVPVLLGKIFGKRIVVAYHGGAAGDFLARSPAARKILKMADLIVVPSGYLRDVFEGMELEAMVIPNMVDTKNFGFCNRPQIAPDFIVSRHLEPDYDVETAIRAFKIVWQKYPGARLKICGTGSEKERLEALVKDLGMEKNVSFLGSVANDKMPELYSLSSIFLNTSKVDNMPVAILEAFACGLPVVSTKAGGIPYMVEDGRTGLLVEVGDYEGIAKRALRLIEYNELAQRLISNARKELGKYSWESVGPMSMSILSTKRLLRPLRGLAMTKGAKFYQNTIFKLLDIFRGRKNIQRLEFLRKSQYWSTDKLDKWQLDKLNGILSNAKENSPFYRDRLKNIKLPIKNISEMQNLPVLTKSDIRKNMDSIKCSNAAKDLFILGKTGGSTGEPMHYYYDKRGRDWNRGCVYRSQEWAGTYLGEKTVQMTGSHYDYTEFKKLKWKMIFWLQRYKSLPISVINDKIFEEYCKEILKYRPTSIWGYSSGIYRFAKFIEEKHKGADFGFLKAIITSSETLFDYQRKAINSVFGDGRVYDHYGSREFYIASECAVHKGYHIHAETVFVEIVDDNGRLKPPGETGRILVTDLTNNVFPFIRYEIGDVGAMPKDAEPCPCGVTLPKIDKIEGRIADLVILPDRVLTPPNFTILLSDYEGIDAYQIRQKTKTDVTVNIVKNGGFKKEHGEYIKKGLRDLVGDGVHAEVRYVDHIDIPASGKRRYVISEVGQGAI